MRDERSVCRNRHVNHRSTARSVKIVNATQRSLVTLVGTKLRNQPTADRSLFRPVETALPPPAS